MTQDGKLLWGILTALATTQDGQTKLEGIVTGTEPIASLAEFGSQAGIDLTGMVSMLEKLTDVLNAAGAQEVTRRLSAGPNDSMSTSLRRLEAATETVQNLLLALPECRKARQEQIAANILEELCLHFTDPSDEDKLVAYATSVAEKVLDGESLPTPDQLIAGFQTSKQPKRRQKTK